MARVRITEYTAKNLLTQSGIMHNWKGMNALKSTTVSYIISLFGTIPLVVKVDEGIKKRAKQGLVLVNCNAQEIVTFMRATYQKGYSQYLIEPFYQHKAHEEAYLSIERTREGMKILYGEKGGMHVEEAWDLIKTYVVSDKKHISGYKIPNTVIVIVEKLIAYMNMYHISFLEINPLVLGAHTQILDCAAEVDDTAFGLQNMEEIKTGIVQEKNRHEAEEAVSALDANTPASLKFTLLNKNGSVWMLLSGGGASLVLADEVADSGKGELLANYGEYSGSPTSEDTYLYTKAILSALCESTAAKKVLIIAGGVANFTDVVKTFKGIIQALSEVSDNLKKQKVLVYVRRGGPHQEKGLSEMKKFLIQKGLFGSVDGPDLPLAGVIRKALVSL